MTSEADLLEALRRYWGYSAFRPLQERIVRSLLAGNDTCVVMPTGGGKSLCYQLPAVISGKTAVVISPLIALMQDQAAQLAQMGIPAAVLNSSLDGSMQNRVMRQAEKGEYRLLYLSPERLQRADTVHWLQKVPIGFFAIDEAHCISEWGHEFRPEYRHLKHLRERFPDRPIAAFTASATRHVRHDILEQLALRNPDKYIASFHRPNLRYLVSECESVGDQSELLLRGLRNYTSGNVIVYSPTINRVEETVDFLENHGVSAVPYHAKMQNEDRRRNQELWMSDEVRVLVGTIAFGLGINKANVRAVIHLALPKSVEQYYQEAGRAGRDGEPADCVLLWQKRDAGLLGHFANQILDSAERDRAWQRYYVIRAFAEDPKCRHRQICVHFGETPKWVSCSNCDVCGNAPEWLKAAGTPALIKAVSTGTKTALPPKPASADDVALREYLGEWRRMTAKEQGVPAFVVLHDTSLDEIVRNRPASIPELLRITGIGERKADRYGHGILAALEHYKQGARAQAVAPKKTAPALETLQLLAQGKTLQQVAKARERQLGTIVSSVTVLVETGQVEFDPSWVDRNKQAVIEAACERVGLDKLEKLRTLKDMLPAEVTYDEIRLVLAKMRRELDKRKTEIPA